MIIREFYRTRNDGVNLYRTYSDINLMIRKVGTDEVYSEAIDIENALYIYEETDIEICEEESENNETSNNSDISDKEFRQIIEEALQ